MVDWWYSWFAAAGSFLFSLLEFVDSRFQHAGWPWPRRTIRKVIPRRLWLPATRCRRRCPRCPSYTVTLACNRQQAPVSATGGGTAQVLRRSTWRLDREPRCLLCRLGIRISTYDILSEIAVIAIRPLVLSMAILKMKICENKEEKEKID